MKKTIFILVLLVLFSNQLSAQYNIRLLGKKAYPGQSMSSIWGYTDSNNGKKYAIIGTSKGTSIVDISNPAALVEVAFANGSNGSWREVKVYNKHAYISQDNNIDTLTSEGILILDLSNLPASIKVDSFRRDNLNNRIAKTHSLSIDEKGFLYLNGGRTFLNNIGQNGCVMYDLKSNPKKPQFVGFTPSPAGTTENYVHDSYARNDTLFASNVYSGKLSVFDVRDKTNPKLIVRFRTPFDFTHNSWLSDDSKTIFTTDEKASAPIGVYDIRDIKNPIEIGQIKSSPNETSIPHNVHVWNDYLIVPHYTLGVVIWDVSDPKNIIKIGYYDTNNFAGSGFKGVWGAYPYFADSTLILSDIEGGLFVLKPTYKRAARIEGTVIDTNTLQPITGVKISFVDTSINVITTIDGIYKTGIPKAGTFLFKAEKTGYITKYFTAILSNGVTIVKDIQLRQIPIEEELRISICEGNSYLLTDGNLASTSGTYISNVVSVDGRETITTTILIVKPVSTTIFTIHICDGESYQLPNGSVVTTNTIYRDTLINSLLCDSIVSTIVNVHPTYDINKTDSFYLGDIYLLPNGNSTSSPGEYINDLKTVDGCDSTIILQLSVLDTITLTSIRNNLSSSFQLKYSVQNQQLSIFSTNGTALKELYIYNSIGILQLHIVRPTNIILLPNLAKDIYILQAISSQNEQHIGKLVIY